MMRLVSIFQRESDNPLLEFVTGLIDVAHCVLSLEILKIST